MTPQSPAEGLFMPRVRHCLVAAFAAVALAATACGGGGSGGGGNASGPSGLVLSALQTTAGSGTLTTTIRLDATAAALQALAHASNHTLDAASADALNGASVVIENSKSGGKSNIDLRVLEGGSALLELRSVTGSLYLQADVRGILTQIHKQKLYANLHAETSSMPAFVKAAFAGKWVSIPAAALSSLTQATGSGSGSGTSAQGIKLLAELHDVIKKDVTVTSAGHDARGDHYVLSGDEKTLSADLQAAISDSVPGGGVLGQRIPSASAQHRTIHVDAWVNGGALSALSIDLAQFGDPGTVPAGTTLPLLVTFERSGDSIDAPSGAVPVDLTQLGTLVGALTKGGSG